MDSVAKITDFDQSLLVWHIATDLCGFPKNPGAMDKETIENHEIAETLSEYMMYLLIKQPEMLSARTGIWLMRYQDTCAEARRFFKSMGLWIQNDDDARKMLLAVNTSKHPTEVKGGDSSMSVLFDACILAKALRQLIRDHEEELLRDHEEELLWRVLAGVWVEMLTYAARKCPGSTHVRQLNRGGELITLIWFLMEHVGLGETLQPRTAEFSARLVVHDQ